MSNRVDVEELRKELRSRRAAVTNKIRRIEKTGVKIRDTTFDPRRDTKVVNKYNIPQMRNYLKKLNEFVDRNNQYVAGHNNKPIPIAQWRAYSAAEAKANARADKLYEKYRNVVIDKEGNTIGMRDAYTRSDFPTTANPAVNSPFQKINRVPRQVTTQKALRQMTKQQQKKIDPKFITQFVADGKRDLRKMLKVAGQSEMMGEINRLTDKQFHILWGYTSFATDISIAYETEKKGRTGRADEKLMSDSMSGAREMLDFIKTIKDTNPNRKNPKRK